MRNKLIEGVYAALLTPRSAEGVLDEGAFVKEMEFLLSHKVDGFAINGATGEFCLTTPGELRQLVQLARETMGSAGRFVCGVGSTNWRESLAGAEMAAGQGAIGVLLPTPYFFRYDQEDIRAYCVSVASASPLPVLLYNLPQFTSAFEAETVLRLLADHSNIVGIKDSGGSLDILSAITSGGVEASRIVGSDNALVEARERQLCDAVISGVACVLPELIQAVFGREASAGARLQSFLERIAGLPTPWALKWIAEARGLFPAMFAQPLSSSRREEGAGVQRWFRESFATNGELRS